MMFNNSTLSGSMETLAMRIRTVKLEMVASAFHPHEILSAVGAASTLMAMAGDDSSDDSSFGHLSEKDSGTVASSFFPSSGEDDSTDSSLSVAPSDGSVGDDFLSIQGTPNIKINLYDPADEGRIGDVHNVFRRDIYEGYIIQPGQHCAGTVAFRCRFCQHLPHQDRVRQSEITPRTVEGLYRAQIRFKRDHFPFCEFIPDEIKAKVAKLERSSHRGKKAYWVASARNKGLVNGHNGIVLRDNTIH